MTKHPSRKVMNFRHLLGCDTIEIIIIEQVFGETSDMESLLLTRETWQRTLLAFEQYGMNKRDDLYSSRTRFCPNLVHPLPLNHIVCLLIHNISHILYSFKMHIVLMSLLSAHHWFNKAPECTCEILGNQTTFSPTDSFRHSVIHCSFVNPFIYTFYSSSILNLFISLFICPSVHVTSYPNTQFFIFPVS